MITFLYSDPFSYYASFYKICKSLSECGSLLFLIKKYFSYYNVTSISFMAGVVVDEQWSE